MATFPTEDEHESPLNGDLIPFVDPIRESFRCDTKAQNTLERAMDKVIERYQAHLLCCTKMATAIATNRSPWGLLGKISRNPSATYSMQTWKKGWVQRSRGMQNGSGMRR